MAAKLKGIPVAPLTGLLDTRSSADLIPQGALRYRQNFQTVGEGKLRRGCGWSKALNKSGYNNQDFHDQLLTFGGTTREPITMLAESESSRGIRTLWAATRSRIARLNETTGNWKIIASGMGGGAGTDCSGRRFRCANVGDYMIFTNNYDRPKVHRLEQPPFDSTLIADIPDLEVIGLTKAAVIWAWKDIIFLADVEMDNERVPNRIVWGDLRNPTSFDPSKPESIAGYRDLNYGERVLAALPTQAGTCMVYTTEGIWEISAVGGNQVFQWREAYPGKKSDYTGILKYEGTLIDIGGEHLYMAKDGIYAFDPYRSRPEQIAWLHRASATLFENLDRDECAAHIAFVHGDEAFFSVKRVGDACPGLTLRIETNYKVADYIDHGFTAATNFRSQPVPSIRDFILDKRICTLAGMKTAFEDYEISGPFVNEGLPAPFATPSAAFAPESFYTQTTQAIGDVTTEDWERETADTDSLCALLGELSIDQICQRCEGVSALIVASSQDWCLKEMNPDVFYRERCVNTSAVGTTSSDGYTSAIGSYILDGYNSLLRFSPMFTDEAMVCVEVFKLKAVPVYQVSPAILRLRVGISGQQADPNDDNCLIVWTDCTTRELKCLTRKTSEQHKATKTSPSEDIKWKFHHFGRNVFLEFKITGTGGDCTLSGVIAEAKPIPAKNY